MSDSTLNRFLASGTNAARLAFVPSVPTPASGPSPAYVWYETDTGSSYIYASAAWHGPFQFGTLFLTVANNLSDVASAATARTNLGLGTAATQNTGTSGSNVPLLNGANTWSGAQAVAALLDIQQNLQISGDISPTSLSTSQNDYSPTGLSTAAVVRQDCSANVNITGLTGGADGRVIVWQNISAANTQTLQNQNAGSSAANRFITSGGTDVTLAAGGMAILVYDSTSSRWRVFSGGGGGGGTGTVTSVGLTSGNLTITGSPVTTAGTLTADIPTNGVGNTLIRQSGALAVVGRSANSTGNVADIQATAASGKPLIETGSTLAFGTLTVIGGGTGAVTLTNHGVLLGQGTSAVAATSAGTAGQVLTSNGAAADPTFQAPASVLLASSSPSGVTTVTFSGISGSYTHLRIVGSGRSSGAGTGSDNIAMTFNSDTAANYAQQFLTSSVTSTTSVQLTGASNIRAGELPKAGNLANSAGSFTVDIPLYSGATFHKAAVGHYAVINNTTTAQLFNNSMSGVWTGAPAAITRIDLVITGNWVAGSTVSLYGLS